MNEILDLEIKDERDTAFKEKVCVALLKMDKLTRGCTMVAVAETYDSCSLLITPECYGIIASRDYELIIRVRSMHHRELNIPITDSHEFRRNIQNLNLQITLEYVKDTETYQKPPTIFDKILDRLLR